MNRKLERKDDTKSNLNNNKNINRNITVKSKNDHIQQVGVTKITDVIH